MSSVPLVGVLALQGAFANHVRCLDELDVPARTVRTPQDLHDLAGLVIPGGESTVISKLLTSSELWEPLAKKIEAGMGVLGTCAGMILLAKTILDGTDDQRSLGAMDLTVRRNAQGSQHFSHESSVKLSDDFTDASIDSERAFPGVFIRPPVVEDMGQSVETLGWLEQDGSRQPVLCRQGKLMASSFHPELSGDLRIHRAFVASLQG